MTENDFWVTEKEISRITGIAVQTLRNDRCRGRGIPYSKIRSSVRYRVKDAVQWMEKNKIVPGDQDQ